MLLESSLALASVLVILCLLQAIAARMHPAKKIKSSLPPPQLPLTKLQSKFVYFLNNFQCDSQCLLKVNDTLLSSIKIMSLSKKSLV